MKLIVSGGAPLAGKPIPLLSIRGTGPDEQRSMRGRELVLRCFALDSPQKDSAEQVCQWSLWLTGREVM